MNPYNTYAKEWTDSVRKGQAFSHDYIEKPAMRAKLPGLSGKRVLCIGCGSGDECKELTDRGATVVGIDSAAKLIDIAKADFPAIDFRVMDMEELDFPAETFDFVYSSLTMHYKEHWTKTLRAVHRILKPNADFLFSTIHPTTWAAETISKEGYKARLLGYEERDGNMIVHGDYLSTRLIHDSWWGYFNVELYSKPLSETFKEIREAGFTVTDFVEPRPISTGKAADPRQYARYQRLPFFAVFELRKGSA